MTGVRHQPGARDEIKRASRLHYDKSLVKLVPEPQNRHDHEAIAVWLNGTQVGYVPRSPGKHVLLNYLRVKAVSSVQARFQQGQELGKVHLRVVFSCPTMFKKGDLENPGDLE